MAALRRFEGVLLAAFLLAAVPAIATDAGGPLNVSEIAFDDLAPPGVTLGQAWSGAGQDEAGRIYLGFTSNLADGREDFLVFRFDPGTGARRYLGSFATAAAAAGVSGAGEDFPKGHTRLIVHDGKVFMGSQGFHDFKAEIDELPRYRGGRIFAYDIGGERWEVLGSDEPGGVLVEHEGIVALELLPERELLVGLTHPLSNLLLYDLNTMRVDRLVDGIPWSLGSPVARQIVAAASGRIYLARGTEKIARRAHSHPIWVYDPDADSLTKAGDNVTDGFWIGRAETRDGRTVYLSTVNGRLYAFDRQDETFRDLGNILSMTGTDADSALLFAIALSPDEADILFVPRGVRSAWQDPVLHAYSLGTGAVRVLGALPCCTYTGGDLRDADAVYFTVFGTPEERMFGAARLVRIALP